MNRPPMILLCFAMLMLNGILRSQSIDCPCDTTKGHHIRKAVKNRHLPASFTAQRTATIKEMIHVWDITNAEFQQEPSHTYAREDTIFLVNGYLHRVLLSDDDCDFHLEIASSKSKTAKHVIVEIPNTKEYCALRATFLQGVIGKEKVDKGNISPITTIGKSVTVFKDPPKISVTGYAFLDTGHWSSTDHHRGDGSHGSAYVWSLWEIHPVMKVEFKQ